MSYSDFNLKQLVSTEVRDKYKSGWYFFQTEKLTRDWKSFWRKKKISSVSGIYKHSFNEFKFICSVEDFKNNSISKEHLLIDNIVFNKPSVKLIFTNEESVRYLFDTIEEAEEYEATVKKESEGIWINNI